MWRPKVPIPKRYSYKDTSQASRVPDETDESGARFFDTHFRASLKLCGRFPLGSLGVF